MSNETKQEIYDKGNTFENNIPDMSDSSASVNVSANASSNASAKTSLNNCNNNNNNKNNPFAIDRIIKKLDAEKSVLKDGTEELSLSKISELLADIRVDFLAVLNLLGCLNDTVNKQKNELIQVKSRLEILENSNMNNNTTSNEQDTIVNRNTNNRNTNRTNILRNNSNFKSNIIKTSKINIASNNNVINDSFNSNSNNSFNNPSKRSYRVRQSRSMNSSHDRIGKINNNSRINDNSSTDSSLSSINNETINITTRRKRFTKR
jgi:hypothetical protein